MKTYCLVLNSKNQISLNQILKFLNKNWYLKNNILKKVFPKKTIKKKFTILKSPNVNKSAQEQFEIKINFKQISIMTTQNLKFLVFLKRLKTYLYSDINVKLKILYSYKHTKKLNQKIFNFDFYKNPITIKKIINHSTLKQLQLQKIYQYKNKKFSLNNNFNKNCLRLFEMSGKNLSYV